MAGAMSIAPWRGNPAASSLRGFLIEMVRQAISCYLISGLPNQETPCGCCCHDFRCQPQPGTAQLQAGWPAAPVVAPAPRLKRELAPENVLPNGGPLSIVPDCFQSGKQIWQMPPGAVAVFGQAVPEAPAD